MSPVQIKHSDVYLTHSNITKRSNPVLSLISQNKHEIPETLTVPELHKVSSLRYNRFQKKIPIRPKIQRATSETIEDEYNLKLLADFSEATLF